jgi:hypothetical protein
MWVKKTKKELEDKFEREVKKNTKRKLYLYNALFYGISIFVILIFGDKTGFSKFGDIERLDWIEIFEKLPIYLLISFAVFIIAYFFQRRTNISLLLSDDEETTYICDKCNKKKTDDGKYDCECGGKYIHINQMKWVEDEENNDEDNEKIKTE